MQSESRNNKISKLIENTLKNVSGLIDVNTVVGKPIRTENNELIIPISKVTIGVLVGGGEYGKLSIFKKNDDLPYSAGNGAVVSVKPCGFLVQDDGKYKVLAVSENSYEKIIDKATEFLESFNAEKH